MKPAYLSLCTQFYDLILPEAGSKEIAYYEALLRTSKGPFLEAMCGSGRLLIPLLKKGFQLEGLDSSIQMLQSCQKRCKEQGLEAQLHHQMLQNLALSQKYDLIFIVIGSFQLIQDRREALQILKNLRKALLPKGKLVLETVIPWAAIKENFSSLLQSSKEIAFERSVYLPDGSEIICKSKASIDLKEQLETTQIRYEKWADGQMIAAEEEEHALRWYYEHEMELLLERGGFSSIEKTYREPVENEQRVIYTARE